MIFKPGMLIEGVEISTGCVHIIGVSLIDITIYRSSIGFKYSVSNEFIKQHIGEKILTDIFVKETKQY